MLKKFVIERNAPGVGASSEEEIREMARKSNSALAELGPGIQWRESYMTDDKIYCVYMAENKELVKEHAKMAGIPADKISEVKEVLDPTSEGSATRGYDSKLKENVTHTQMS